VGVRYARKQKFAVLAGLIEGDGNLYVSRGYNTSYVRLYTPDVTQILWTIDTAMELFDKYPIIGIDKLRGNKRLYILLDSNIMILTFMSYLTNTIWKVLVKRRFLHLLQV